MAGMAIHQIETELGAEMMPYGPAMPVAEGGIEIAATFGQYEAEYAAIRRHVGIFHQPQRGILRFTGADRQDFLHRMVTQDVNGMSGGSTRRSFQLNGKGRIIADMRLHHGDLDTWLEMDRLDVPQVESLLSERLFAEDVTIEDISDQRSAAALHGPAAASLLQSLTQDDVQAAVNAPGTHHVLSVDGHGVTVYRLDDAGSLGLHLLIPAEGAEAIYRKLLDAAGYEHAAEPDAEFGARRRQSLRGRPIGWQAYNTARIEAGTAIFHVDFGTDALPGETGLLDEAVSFTKGCYLGQEIVARMQNLGHPKRMLVGLKLPGDALPIAGSQVFDAADRSTLIGAVTSSTLSPIRGNLAIAFGVVKWGHHEIGKAVAIPAEGELIDAQVHTLRFLDD